MAPPSVISFDVGGTLLSAAGGGFSRYVCEFLGLDLRAVRPLLVRHFLTRDLQFADAVEAFCAELGCDGAGAIVANYRKPLVSVYPEVPDLLPLLKHRGYRIITFSNCCPWEGGDLHDLGLGQYFERSFHSYTLGYAKPQTDAFRLVEEALGEPGSSFLHIGDSWEADVIGARTSGWQALPISRTVNSDGSESAAHRGLSSLSELPKMLDQLDAS